MQYVFKARRYFGNPLKEDELKAWKADCAIRFGPGVAIHIEKLPGTYAYYVDKSPETYTKSYGEWASRQ